MIKIGNYSLTRAAVAIMATATLTLLLASCNQHQQADINQPELALFDSLVTEAWEAKNENLLPVIDSLEAAGKLTASKADFVRGVTYDRARHIKIGESYYAKLYETVNPDKEGWDFYMEVANRLAQIRMTMSDQKGSIAVATEIMERAEKAGKLTDERKSAYLWSIALCQYALGMNEADETSKQVYELLEKRAGEHSRYASRSLMIFTYVIAEEHLIKEEFAEAEEWIVKCEGMLKRFTEPGDSAIVREYTGNLAMSRVYLLEGLKKEDEAYAFFRKSFPKVVTSPEGMTQAATYLLEKEKYAEAADLYNHIDEILPADNKESEINLDNIQRNIIPRLLANLGAERRDSVVSIARYIAENYVKALNDYKEGNAAELAIIYDTQGKEMQIAEQQANLSKQRTTTLLVVLVLLCIFFILYTEYRRRAANRLEAAHVKLQEAYNQLEETTTAKERIESELRIARDIQMSMVPGVFPEYDGLDMFASMTPAKEVGGDLYGYVMQGESLYFCVGDVSGKGIPASLFMSQVARLFRTLATEGLTPVDIAVRINSELAENNDRGMFVTMFIGLLHLDTGRLDYCNCGHNPPVFDGQFLEMAYDNQPLGLWEDDPFYGETIDDIRGKQLLVYTDGLNEAENQQKELFGNKRLLELMSKLGTSSMQTIQMLEFSVEAHRDGADPNDDLTLMCITFNNKQ